MGAEKYTEGRVGRQQRKQATPSGTTAAKSTGNQNRHAPPPGTTAARRGKPPRRKPTFSFPFPTQEGKTFPQPVEKRVEKHAAWYAVLLMHKPFSRFFAVFRHDSTAAGVWKRPHGARKPHLLRQGQDSRAKISEVTDRISAARSAGIRPPPNA